MVENIHWLGHDTFKITGERTIYTDPFQIRKEDLADLILITHEHRDHCSPEDIKKLRADTTVVLAPSDCAEKIRGNFTIVKPGDVVEAFGIRIEVVPAYNTNKSFHTKDRSWVGYIFTVGGKRIYLAGDTDRIPEMKTFRADVALLPVSGTYVMTADEAADAALDIHASVAIPMHYGSIVGSPEDAKKFAENLKGKIEVAVLSREE